MKNASQWRPCDAHAAIDILHTSANIVNAYTRFEPRTGKELGVVAQVAIEYAPEHFHHYWIAQDMYADKPPTPVANYTNGRFYGLYNVRKDAGGALQQKAVLEESKS